MKTNVSSLTLLVAALGCFLAASLQAAPQSPPATAYAVDHINRDGANVVMVGTSDSTVCRWLGTPDRKIGNDVWVYNHFRASLEEAQENDCRTLLLTVTNGKVGQILIVNDRAFASIAAATKVDPAAMQRVFVAAK